MNLGIVYSEDLGFFDEAIAQSKPELKKKAKILKKKEVQEEEEDKSINNQILNFGNKPIKRD